MRVFETGRLNHTIELDRKGIISAHVLRISYDLNGFKVPNAGDKTVMTIYVHISTVIVGYKIVTRVVVF